jgi:hypothetical protein
VPVTSDQKNHSISRVILLKVLVRMHTFEDHTTVSKRCLVWGGHLGTPRRSLTLIQPFVLPVGPPQWQALAVRAPVTEAPLVPDPPPPPPAPVVKPLEIVQERGTVRRCNPAVEKVRICSIE